MSPLPMSRTAVDKLGKRLAAGDAVSDHDLDLLLEVLNAYQDALDETQTRLAGLGYHPTSRTKTTGVLIDKLRREHSSLKSVQDIAGTRIICADRMEQDDIVAAVALAFSDGSREPRVRDRRLEPSHGYRAVHVVVTVQDLPVEIQVRTERQDRWAQIVESLGDRWGRQIRYGEPPPEPERLIHPEASLTRAELWTLVLRLAERTDSVERFQEGVWGILRLSRPFEEAGMRDRVAEPAREAGDDELIRQSESLLRRAEELKQQLAIAEVDLSRELAMFSALAESLD